MNNQQIAWHKALKDHVTGTPLPPCPNCGQHTMESWDAWLITGETCTACGWGDSEGGGCLV